MMVTPLRKDDEWGMSERSQALARPPPNSWLRGDTTGAGRLLFSWLPGSSADSYHAYKLNLRLQINNTHAPKFLRNA